MNTLLRKVLSLLLCMVMLASILSAALAVSVVTDEPTATAEATATPIPASADEAKGTAAPAPDVTPETAEIGRAHV